MEELVIRRELSDNFCYYNDHYDSVEGSPIGQKKHLPNMPGTGVPIAIRGNSVKTRTPMTSSGTPLRWKW
jgi:hypothetical protein